MDFSYLREVYQTNMENNYWILSLRQDALKTTSKKVIHKAAEAGGEFIGNKITDKTVKQKPLPAKNSRNVEEIIIPPEKKKKKEIQNELRKEFKK